MKVYIAGIVSLGGKLPIEEQLKNRERFSLAEHQLRARGLEPVNPLALNPPSPDTSWKEVMREDLKALLNCDAVYALDGWDQGVGSVIEVELAKALGMPVFKEEA